MNYVPTIGLEVHVQLRTKSKMFCGCRAGSDAGPNMNVCPVCLGYPGAMPVINEEAVRCTVITGLMVGSRISGYSKFDRKSYFYPDMPKNYQISQYDSPLCIGGAVEIQSGGVARTVHLTRIHLEEDVAKSMHFPGSSGVDFNRAGVPLMEIVTDPDMESPEQAFDFLLTLKQIIQYAGVSDCNLEDGNVRCDVNCSVRPAGRPELGTKTELKNLNTFKGVLAALHHEIHRQVDTLEQGGVIVQETRRWDADMGQTFSMRSKEEAHDYRYFPEPDLVPVALPAELIARWKSELPELPRQRCGRFVAQYGLPEYDAKVLVADKGVADFFEEAAKHSANAKGISNVIMTEVLRFLAETEKEISGIRLTPKALADLVALTDRQVVNSTTAKEVLNVMLADGGDPGEIVSARGLTQVSDSAAIEDLVVQAIAANPRSVEDYRKGKKASLQFLIGQVMRVSRGKANPGMVMELLKKQLG